MVGEEAITCVLMSSVGSLPRAGDDVEEKARGEGRGSKDGNPSRGGGKTTGDAHLAGVAAAEAKAKGVATPPATGGLGVGVVGNLGVGVVAGEALFMATEAAAAIASGCWCLANRKQAHHSTILGEHWSIIYSI